MDSVTNSPSRSSCLKLVICFPNKKRRLTHRMGFGQTLIIAPCIKVGASDFPSKCASNLFSLYLCIQDSNCHKFKWFGFVWLSSFAECINYSVILWDKILTQELLFSYCSPASSLVSAHISCRTLIFCSISVLTVHCAEELIKFCAELTKIDVFTHTWLTPTSIHGFQSILHRIS